MIDDLRGLGVKAPIATTDFWGKDPMFSLPPLTDGDVIVWFRRSDVIATGDAYSTTSYPKFDATRGGTMQGVLDVLNRVIDIAVSENSHVSRDGLLFQIDPVPYRLAVAQAEADLNIAEAQLENLRLQLQPSLKW